MTIPAGQCRITRLTRRDRVGARLDLHIVWVRRVAHQLHISSNSLSLSSQSFRFQLSLPVLYLYIQFLRKGSAQAIRFVARCEE